MTARMHEGKIMSSGPRVGSTGFISGKNPTRGTSARTRRFFGELGMMWAV